MNHDVHNYERRFERQVSLLNEDKSVSEANKKLILKFCEFAFSQGISTGRVVRYLFDLRVLAGFLGKNFEDANKEDIQNLLAALEKSGRFARSTMRDLKLTLRKFYKWLRKTEGFPEEVSWYKTHIKYNAIKNPEELLSEEDVKKMISVCSNPMEKAFIATLYESGCRIGEILPLRLNQVKFDDYGALLLVNGKTGFRRVRVVASLPYLIEWINNHPLKNNQKAFLWINRNLTRASYANVVQMLRRRARKANVNKRVNPHNYRHSRASYLANFLTEAQMNEYFGWAQGSDMPSVYVHLSGRDVDRALLKVYGIEANGDKKESAFKPKECMRCKLANPATNRFCSRCGMPLDEEARNEVIKEWLERKKADDILDRLLEDEEFREFFIKKLEAMRDILQQ